MADVWDPGCYETFAAERRQPFDDLLALVRPCPGGRAVDLGCGTGALTAELHAATGAAATLGIDSSPAMLERAGAHAAAGVRFEAGDIAGFGGSGYDLVFANASLQWLPDHPALLRRLVAALGPGGQLAFQVPANYDHPSHAIAEEMAGEEPWRSVLGEGRPRSRRAGVLPPERYAEILDGLGLAGIHVRLQVYGHHLPSTGAVLDWVRATLLTPFRAALGPEDYEAFLGAYRDRLLAALGERSPYFYAFKRILVHATLPA